MINGYKIECIIMKKRLLFVNHSLKIGGGANRIAAEIANGLSRRGYDVTFLKFYDYESEYNVEGEVLSFEENPQFSYPFEYSIRNLKRGRKIAKICKKRDIDTVVSFCFAGNYSTTLSRAIFNNDSKTIISQRNNPLTVNKNKVSMTIKKRLFPKSDLIISLSKSVEHLLKSEWGIENTTTIYNPQPLEKFQKMGNKTINLEHESLFSDEYFVYINVGRLVKQKGQWHLLRVFKKLQKKDKKSRLIILGDGSLKKRLDRLIKKLGLENKVFFLGVVENVFPYLRKSDCFVFPSLFEGFGNAQIEALSQNLPVISADCVAGPRDILSPKLEMGDEVNYPYYGEYGILTKPFDQEMSFESLEKKSLTGEEETLAQAMIEIKEDEKLREKYSNGVERVKDFDSDRIIDQWEKVI